MKAWTSVTAESASSDRRMLTMVRLDFELYNILPKGGTGLN